MRTIRVMILGLSLGILPSTWAAAQDTAKPAVQVVIGADGSIKVVDANTGKELPSAVLEVPGKPAVAPDGVLRAVVVQKVEAANARKAEEDARAAAQAELEKARKFLQDIQDKKKAAPELDGLRFELQIAPGSDGQPKVLFLQKKTGDAKPSPAAGSLESKVDRLLQEMTELRKDVHQLKAKLDGKSPERPSWNQYYWPSPAAKDQKPGTGSIEIELQGGLNLKDLEELLKKFDTKKAPEKTRTAPMAPARSADLEQRLERILQEAEALRREIQKSKAR